MHKFRRGVDHKLWCSSTLTLQDSGPAAAFSSLVKPTSVCFATLFHDLAELAETLDRLKAVRLQDQFGFQILHTILRRYVGVVVCPL